jgi:hypothetical protein
MVTLNHLRCWGAVYIILAFFLASWIGQAVAMQPTIHEEGWTEFWAATFENWQSEFLQLAVQATMLGALSHLLFKAQARDTERLEAKVDEINERLRKWDV